MPIPVALLVSATRSSHSLSLRRVAKHLGMPFSTLAACENFLYPLPVSIATPLAKFFYLYPPPENLINPPPDERTLSYMCHRDSLFHALIPLLEHAYHARRSAHGVGNLFLVITQIFLVHEGATLWIRAPHDQRIAQALRHLLVHWWASPRRQEAFGVRYYHLISGGEGFVASFDFKGGGSVYSLFFPEQEGKDCYFAYLFLYTLLKRMIFGFSLDLEKLACHSILMARAPLEIAAREGRLLSPTEAAEVLRWAGSPPLAVADALVLHGPQGDITLLTNSVTDASAYWIVLKGDLFGGEAS